MSTPSLVVAISLGSAALALWIFVRSPGFAPSRPGVKMLHFVAALVVAQFGAPAAMSLALHGSDTVERALVALFLVFLPSQLYAYLSGIWVLALLRNVLHAR